ncbi:hypothetical protein ACPC54_13705 [Kitasatospora sp. NPDC094028]
MSTSRSRTFRSPARRVLAVCALTGAALLTTMTTGQAWADETPKPVAATPTATPSAAATPTAAPAPAGKDSGPAVSPARTATPSPMAPGGAQPQVREVPKGAAKAGDGSGAGSDSSGLMLASGGAVAAVGAGALGFAVLRRRAGARG